VRAQQNQNPAQQKQSRAQRKPNQAQQKPNQAQRNPNLDFGSGRDVFQWVTPIEPLS
jgi:hypothetical protein